MKRGDVVTVAIQGDYGKPRPAVIIQSDLFDRHPSVTVLPITSQRRDAPLFRIGMEPTATNGLRKPSQVMVDKAVTVARGKIRETIGQADEETMLAVVRALAVFLGVA